jgi:ParB family transcriptional regulator, chromosome partitioning protein
MDMEEARMGNPLPARKRGLGRGLGALIRNTESYHPNDVEAPAPVAGLQTLPVAAIQPNPRQPRMEFDPDALAELAASIRQHGILQPLIVTEDPHQAGRYFLVAGERRWRAAQVAGLDTAPALVREASPSQLLEWALIENVQRADLNPLEEASAYQALMDEFGLTQDEVAERVGKSRPAVANLVRLLVQAAVTTGEISAGHARALLRLEEKPAVLVRTLELIQSKALSVRQTEALVAQLLEADAAPPAKAEVHPQLSHLENRFRTVLGTRVNLSRNANGSGRLTIHFYNDDDLEQLYQLITGGDEPA